MENELLELGSQLAAPLVVVFFIIRELRMSSPDKAKELNSPTSEFDAIEEIRMDIKFIKEEINTVKDRTNDARERLSRIEGRLDSV